MNMLFKSNQVVFGFKRSSQAAIGCVVILIQCGCSETSKSLLHDQSARGNVEVLRPENLAKVEDVRDFYDALLRGDLQTCSSAVLAPGKRGDYVFFPRSFLERCLGADQWAFLSSVGSVVHSKDGKPTLLTIMHSTYVRPPEPYLKHFRQGNWLNLNRVDAWVRVGDEWKVIPQEVLSGRVLHNLEDLTLISDSGLWEQGDLQELLLEVKEAQRRSAAGGL
jgi:hypothetical protein